MNESKRVFILTTVTLAFAGSAFAEEIKIENAGFEAQNVADGKYIDKGAPTGWVVYDPHKIIGHNYSSLGVLNPTGTKLFPKGAPQGKNVALVFLWPYKPNLADAGKPAGIQQTLAAKLEANTEYVLTVQVGNIAVQPPPPKATFNLQGFPGYRVQLLADDQLLAEDNNTLKPGEGEFELSTVKFKTGAAHAHLGKKLAIRFINLNKPDAGIEVNFDDVKLTATPLGN